jgi:Spy/CpxP family protein refolding chaperone
MPEARFLKIVIVALLLINVGTLGYLWLGRPHEPLRHFPAPPPHDGPPLDERRGAAAFLHDALQLTDDQEAAYKKMREQHHAIVLGIRAQMKESKRSLYALLKSNDTASTRSEERHLMDSLASQQRHVEQITYEHFRQVRALCTPQQQYKFDEVVGEALEQMR